MTLSVVPVSVVTCERSTSLGVPVPLVPLAWIVRLAPLKVDRAVRPGKAITAPSLAKT